MNAGASENEVKSQPFSAKGYAIAGVAGSITALLALLLMKTLFDADIYPLLPVWIASFLSAISKELLISTAGISLLMCMLPCMGLFVQRHSALQSAAGMITTVAIALLGFTMFAVAMLYEPVFLRLEKLEAGRLICGLFPAVLACIVCIGGSALCIARCIKTRGAARALSIVSAMLFTAALTMLTISAVVSLFAVLGASYGHFYRPLGDLWTIAPAMLALSLSMLARDA